MRPNCSSYFSLLQGIGAEDQNVSYNDEERAQSAHVSERRYQQLIGLKTRRQRARGWRAQTYVKTDTSEATTTPIQRALSYASLRRQLSMSQ